MNDIMPLPRTGEWIPEDGIVSVNNYALEEALKHPGGHEEDEYIIARLLGYKAVQYRRAVARSGPAY